MQQGFPLTESAHARRTDPLESHFAAEVATTQLSRTRERVLAVLRQHGPLSDEEMIQKIRSMWPDWDVSDANLRSRRSDLHKDGLVHRNGRAVTKHNRTCSRWDTHAA